MRKLCQHAVLLLFLVSSATYGQTLEEVLSKTFEQFESASNLQEKTEASNRLSMIANKWQDEWIAPYYAAYSQIMLSYEEADISRKDQYLNEAEQHLAKAQALTRKNDEVYVMAAMLANARLAVDPQNRWQQYVSPFEENIRQAKAVREENPRIYYLNGAALYYTPEMYGGGKKVALPYFEKAASLYEKEDDHTILQPSWGKEANAVLLKTCVEAKQAEK